MVQHSSLVSFCKAWFVKNFETEKHCRWRLEWGKMADISLDTIKDFFSLKPLSRTNALTDVKITGRHWDQGRNSAHTQQFKLPKKNPQRWDIPGDLQQTWAFEVGFKFRCSDELIEVYSNYRNDCLKWNAVAKQVLNFVTLNLILSLTLILNNLLSLM